MTDTNHGRVPRVNRRSGSVAFSVVLGVMGSLGCSGSDDGDGGGESAEGVGSGPLFLIATYFPTGDSETTYFVTSSRFDEGTRLDPTDGSVLLGDVVPTVWNGSVFAPNSTAPLITRYDVGADDRLTVGAELSFAGVGMTELISWHVYIVSDTKGYVFDPAGSRIIVWNPSEMALTGDQVPLPMLERAGWLPNVVFEHSGVVRRGSTLLVPVGWQDQDFNSVYASGVLAIDLDTDEVISMDEDARCGETYAAVPTPTGEVFFMPPDWSAVPHFFADMHQPTCAPLIPAGATTFDEGPVLDVSALGQGLASTGAVPDGGSGFFFSSLDPALWNGGNEADPVWRVWHHDFGTGASRQVESLPLFSGQIYYVDVGSERFIPHWQQTATGNTTTMYRVLPDGVDPEPVFSFEGSWYGAGRLR